MIVKTDGSFEGLVQTFHSSQAGIFMASERHTAHLLQLNRGETSICQQGTLFSFHEMLWILMQIFSMKL